MRDLHDRRHPVHHNDFVAPVELIGLARRRTLAAQRHPPSRLHSTSPSFAHNGEWRRSRGRSRAPVTPRKSGSGSVALAPALRTFRTPTVDLKLLFPSSKFLGAAAPTTLIRKRRVSSERMDLANRVAGQPQVACDLLDRLAVDMKCFTPYSTDRPPQTQHPPPPASCQSRQPNKSKIWPGQSWTPIPRHQRGQLFPRRITRLIGAEGGVRRVWQSSSVGVFAASTIVAVVGARFCRGSASDRCGATASPEKC